MMSVGQAVARVEVGRVPAAGQGGAVAVLMPPHEALSVLAVAPPGELASALRAVAADEARPETEAQVRARLGRAETAEEALRRREEAFVPASRALVVAPAAGCAAERRARALEAVLQPADMGEVRRWLLSLAAISERAPVGKELLQAVDAIVGVLDLPAICFTADTMREVAREVGKRGGFFPGYGRIDEVLRPMAVAADGERRRLQRVVDAARRPAVPALPAPPRERSEAEIEAVRAASAAFRAEVAAREAEDLSMGRAASRPLRVLTLPERLARLEASLPGVRALAAQAGEAGDIARVRLANMEATAGRWRGQIEGGKR